MRMISTLLCIAICLLYAKLRLLIGYETANAPWNDLVALTAHGPFVYRLASSLVARVLIELTGVSIRTAFQIIEFSAALGLCVSTYTVLQGFITQKRAFLAALALPPLVLLTTMGMTAWRMFYPSDTPALALLVLGILLILRRRFGLLVALLPLATANRETSIVLIWIAALSWHKGGKKSETLKRLGILLAVYLVTRAAIIALVTTDSIETTNFNTRTWDPLASNLAWLCPPDHLVLFLAQLLFLPLFFVLRRNRVPPPLLPLPAAALILLCPLLLFANIQESRAFTEVLALFYLPVAASFTESGSERPLGAR